MVGRFQISVTTFQPVPKFQRRCAPPALPPGPSHRWEIPNKRILDSLTTDTRSIADLLEAVADNGDLEFFVLEPIEVVQLKLGRLNVKIVVVACDDRGN